MRTSRLNLIVVAGLSVLASSHAVGGEPTADATYADIRKTLGLVPTFMKAFPEAGIAAAWDEWRAIELDPKTALPNKTKELIGLAVAAQIPCRYCSYFHAQAAKANGATEVEMKEAIAASALTRHWSTVLNGLQIDERQFDNETQKMFAFAAKLQQRKNQPAAVSVIDAQSAYKDIEQTFGMVPTFMRKFPEAGIAGAWRELKTLDMSPDTALPGKTKDLIGLAVAAQIPCKYCIAFHTKSAKQAGATDKEIAEAVAMAALTRHWSTVLNGNLIDEPGFRREVDEVMKNARNATARANRP